MEFGLERDRTMKQPTPVWGKRIALMRGPSSFERTEHPLTGAGFGWVRIQPKPNAPNPSPKIPSPVATSLGTSMDPAHVCCMMVMMMMMVTMMIATVVGITTIVILLLLSQLK